MLYSLIECCLRRHFQIDVKIVMIQSLLKVHKPMQPDIDNTVSITCTPRKVIIWKFEGVRVGLWISLEQHNFPSFPQGCPQLFK